MQSQNGNWPEATAQLKKVLTDQPDRADILYDSGIAAYKNAEFDKALAYFNKAGDIANAPQELREQAYFNAGNAQVQLKQLQEAIDSYDKALALNPDHEKAKHNKKVVKKMLEQQKQEKQDKEKEKQKEENKENQQNQKDQEKENREENKDQQDQNNSDNQKNQDQKDSEQKQEEQNNKQQNQKQEKESADDKSMADKKKEQEQQQKEQRAQKEKQSANTQSKTDKQEQQQSSQKLSPALEHALNEREKKDAQLNKKMIKAMAAESQTGGKNGNNCW